MRRLAKALDGLTQGDVKAALSRARITLDFPAAEPDATSEGPPPVGKRPPPVRVTVKDLLDAGLIPSGAKLQKRYLGQDLSATVEPDGRIRFADKTCEDQGGDGRQPRAAPADAARSPAGMSALATWLMKRQMEKLDIPPVPEFIELCADSGVGIYACKASVEMFGLELETSSLR